MGDYTYMCLPTGNGWQGAPILIFSNAALNLANKSSPGSLAGRKLAKIWDFEEGIPCKDTRPDLSLLWQVHWSIRCSSFTHHY